MHHMITHIGGLTLEINLFNHIPSSWLWVSCATMQSTLTLVNLLLDFLNNLKLTKEAFSTKQIRVT